MPQFDDSIPYNPSPHFSSRGDSPIAGTVVHYDASPGNGARKWTLDPASKVSWHFHGARDGRFRIFRSGRVCAKGVDLTQVDPSLPRDTAYACLAEALLYALDARFVSHSVDVPTVELMNSMMETARRWNILPSLESR